MNSTNRIYACVQIATLMLGSGTTTKSLCAEPRNELIIVPGKQIGPLALPAQETDVMRVFAGHAFPFEMSQPEGGLERDTLLYPCDPARQAGISYDHETRLVRTIEIGQIVGLDVAACARFLTGMSDPMLKGQLPGDTIGLDLYDWQHRDEFAENIEERAERAMTVPSGTGPSREGWSLDKGVRLGMSISHIQQLNGKPFVISGPEGDAPGGVLDWNGGALSNCLSHITFGGDIAKEDDGRKYHSDDPNLRSDQSRVVSISVYTRPQTARYGACPPDTQR